MAELARATLLSDQLIVSLKEVHALELVSLKMTAAAARSVDDALLERLFRDHHEETREHERIVRERLAAHGETPSTVKDAGARVAAFGKDLSANGASDLPGRLVRDAFVHESAEIAAYALLSCVAERVGDPATTQMARTVLVSEQEAADRLARMWDHAAELSLKRLEAAT